MADDNDMYYPEEITPEQRRQMLQDEFEKVDKDGSGFITRVELYYYLDMKNGGVKFDRNLANQLFNQMEKDLDERVTVNEFVRMWSEAERSLLEMLKECNDDIDESKEKQKKLKELIEQYEAEEKKEKAAVLQVYVFDALNVDSDISYIVVSCGGLRHETEKVRGDNPQFETLFEIKKVTLSNSLKIQLIGANNPASHHLEIEIPLANLDDMLKHEEYFNLYDVKRRQTTTRVRLGLQYISSKAEYYKLMDKKWDETIAELESQKEKHTHDWELLAKPNNFLNRIAHSTFYVKKLVPSHDSKDVDNYDYCERFAVMPPEALHPFRLLSGWFILAFLLVSCLFLFYRNSFLDVTVAGIAISCLFFSAPPFMKTSILFLIITFAIGYIFDIIWLWIYPNNWWGKIYIDDKLMLYPRRWEIILSIVLPILRAFIIALLVCCYLIAPNIPYKPMEKTVAHLSDAHKKRNKATSMYTHRFGTGFEAIGEDNLFLETSMLPPN